MFKKLFIIIALCVGCASNTINASQGGIIQWLKHFGVAYLTYHVIGATERNVVKKLFPVDAQAETGALAEIHAVVAAGGSIEQLDAAQKKWHDKVMRNVRNMMIRGIAGLATFYGCYKLTNHFHEQMSDEPYRFAHLLGALL